MLYFVLPELAYGLIIENWKIAYDYLVHPIPFEMLSLSRKQYFYSRNSIKDPCVGANWVCSSPLASYWIDDPPPGGLHIKIPHIIAQRCAGSASEIDSVLTSISTPGAVPGAEGKDFTLYIARWDFRLG